MRVERLEVIRERSGTFARSEKQDAVPLQREMQQVQDLALGHRLQVDEQVPAADQVEASKRRILENVVRREDDELSELRRNLVVGPAFGEVALEQLGPDVCDSFFFVQTAARKLERTGMHVGRQDLQAPPVAALREALLKQHCNRIRFFACGAAGNPGAELVARLSPLVEFGDHVRLEILEGRGVAEESGYADEQVSKEG